MNRQRLLIALAGAALLVSSLAAQPQVRIRRAGPPPPPPPGTEDVMVMAQAPTFEFIAAEPAFMGKVVAGAPYSADAVSETTRVLADGTRIKNSNTNKVYRDSEGRVRNEHTFEQLGFWVSEGKESKTHVTIMDPVAKQTIILNPSERIARVLPVPPPLPPGANVEWHVEGPGDAVTVRAEATQEGGQKIERQVKREVHVIRGGAGPGRDPGATDHTMVLPRTMVFDGVEDSENVKNEDLGEQTIQGVRVTGKRKTTTIPTGAIGNDRPIVSVSEEWYSPELQVVVQRTVKDPQVGETSYRLENLSRAEPLKSLFEIPAGYEVKETKPLIEKIYHTKSDG